MNKQKEEIRHVSIINRRNSAAKILLILLLVELERIEKKHTIWNAYVASK